MSSQSRSPGRFTPLIVAGATLLLYLATLSHHYTGDSIEYALAIELGDPAYLLDLYHPLLHPLGLAFYRLWQLLGWTGQSLLPLQVLNALAGAICSGLMAALAGHLTGSAALAVLIGLGFAISGGSWMLSVEAEFVTPPLAVMLAVLWALLAAPPAWAGRRIYAVGLGAATAAAFLSYVSSALVAAVVTVGLLLDTRLEGPQRRRQVLLCLATALLAAPLYLGFLALWSGGEWQQVSAQFFGRGSYGQLDLFNLPHGIYAFLRSLALYPGLSLAGGTREFLTAQTATGRAAWAGYYGLILVLALVPLALAGIWRRGLWPAQRRPLLVLATWAGLFGLFGFYWVPGDVTFWMPVLAAWWLLTALVISAAPGTVHAAVSRRWPVGLVIAVVALTAANAAFEILPRRDLSTNLPYQAAADAAARTGKADLFLTRADDISGLYLAYFAGRQVFYAAPETLNRLPGLLPSSPGKGLRRLYAVDVDSGRFDWWQDLLAAGQWQSVEPATPSRTGLLIELTPR